MGRYGNGQLFLRLVNDGKLVFQTVFTQHKEKLCGERQGHILEERVAFVVHISSPQPCALFVGRVCHYGVFPLVQESVNVVVERRSLVDRQLVSRIRGFQHTVCKTVRQIQGGQSPDFGRLLDVLRGVVLVPAEKFHAVCVIVETQHVGADARSDQCGIASGAELDALHALPVDLGCGILHNGLILSYDFPQMWRNVFIFRHSDELCR